MRMLRDEHGDILILTALCMTMLLSFMALAIDVGNLFFTQRQLQTLADSAAMAGALEAGYCGSTPNCALLQKAATSALTEGTPSVTPSLFLQCAPASGAGILLTVNNGPCALGASDPNNGKANYVEVVVSKKTPTWFAGIFGHSTVNISARAEAGYALPSAAPGNQVWANTVYLNGGSIADGPGNNGGVYANSDAFADSGNISAPYTLNSSGSITGNCYNNGTSCGPKPTSITAQPEPFSNLDSQEPSQPGASPTCCANPGGPTTLQPGTYTGLNFNGGNYTVNFAPGLYYFTGTLNGGSNITFSGSGVTIFFAGGGNIQTNSGTILDLSPPSAADIAANPGAYNGCTSCATMSYWVSTGDTAPQILDAGLGTAPFTGNIYDKNGQILMNSGSSITTQNQIVCNLLTLDSGASIVVDSNSSSALDGSPTVVLAE